MKILQSYFSYFFLFSCFHSQIKCHLLVILGVPKLNPPQLLIITPTPL